LVEQYDPAALDEFVEAIGYYQAQRPGLGDKFEAAVSSQIRFLLETPHAGHMVGTRGLRRFRVRGFPYNIIYRPIDEVLLIVAVAHQKRQPNYWHYRL